MSNCPVSTNTHKYGIELTVPIPESPLYIHFSLAVNPLFRFCSSNPFLSACGRKMIPFADSWDTDTYTFIFTSNLQIQIKADYGQRDTEIIRLVMLHMKNKVLCLDKLIASLRKNASLLLITSLNYI